MKQRIVWIDWAKSILIYLMVVGHCFPIAWENQLIYAFHMPAFFIISGYLYKPHHWLKTLKSVGIPVLFFSAINMAIYSLPKLAKGTFDSSDLFLRIFVPFWGPGPEGLKYIILFPGVWFIIALFGCRLLMGDIPVFSFIRKYKYWSLTAFLLFLVLEPYLLPNNPLQDYKLYRTVASMPFVLLGYCMKDFFHIEKLKWGMIILCAVAFVGLSFYSGRCDMLSYHFYPNYSAFFICAVLGSLVLYYLCSKLHGNILIECISLGTIMVLALNFNLRSYINLFFNKVGFSWLTAEHYFYPWFVALLIVAICYFPIIFLRKHAPVLLGK